MNVFDQLRAVRHREKRFYMQFMELMDYYEKVEHAKMLVDLLPSPYWQFHKFPWIDDVA